MAASDPYAIVLNPADLRSRRQRANLTYRGLAAAIHSPGSWSSLRRLEIPVERGGRHTLSVDRAIRIGLALGIPIPELHHWFEFRGVDARAA